MVNSIDFSSCIFGRPTSGGAALPHGDAGSRPDPHSFGRLHNRRHMRGGKRLSGGQDQAILPSRGRQLWECRMTKIIATMATYPGRGDFVEQAAASMADQVDTLNLVLNEHRTVPEWVKKYPSINAIVPEIDTKDTGKYLVPVAERDWLFTIDDDITYPPDYVQKSLASFKAIGESRVIAGYHGIVYRKPRYMITNRYIRMLLGRDPNYIVTNFNPILFENGLDQNHLVDELGTGTTLCRGEDVPPFSFMQSAQRFVDVRLARWSHQTGKKMVCLSRAAQWLKPIRDENINASIWVSFTQSRPRHVAQEIETYAFRNKGTGRPL
jgi:hypothetical protein